MKRSVLAVLSIVAVVGTARCQDMRLQTILQDGEELVYRVRWSFFRLGTVTIRTEKIDTVDGEEMYRVSMLVESNPDIPFIDISELNVCLMNTERVMSKQYYGAWRNGKRKIIIESIYDPDARTMRYRERNGRTEAILKETTLTDVDPYVHGPSLFVFTRWISNRVGEFVAPTVINGQIATTHLLLSETYESINVTGIDSPVFCRRYEGKADWSGATSAGLGGEFTGWITADDAAVVAKAEMGVLLGSVTLELERWHRSGWVPPKQQAIAEK
jgi:hypothetical protein